MSTKYNSMNQALMDLILNHLRNGQVQRCLDIGLDIEVLNQLRQPQAHSILKNAPARWCKIQIDLDMVKRLLENCERDERETRLVHRAIQLGATNGMIREFFGMGPSEISVLRQLLNVPGRSGRVAGLSDTKQVWYRFLDLMKTHGVDYKDPVALLDICMLITEELNGPLESIKDKHDQITLALIWNLVQTWINEGLYPSKIAKAPLLLIADARRRRDSQLPDEQPGLYAIPPVDEQDDGLGQLSLIELDSVEGDNR
ncbi:STY4526/YPO1902 family pathogenicity island replication protein [Pseudomonas sp. EpS/L25]|uniref:STY4526/YPO1902 family pathogenicity island replication protein n=1 Tax=Pseudomonas sp. EpS/L25 TaxID=1749078 RepID=UPI0007438846|nr:STY4526/YPO1902 family pathogenicity island replication protein [Pseudomonas sp. EpS/L25]KUM43708.1 hypothetical protein AR540_18150 [Pseudomonas sp. EpS/L25]